MTVRPPTETTRIAAPDMGRAYDDYFKTGLYTQRYPAPNRRVLRTALGLLPRGGRFIDYGAGTGRYCLPMIEVQGATCIAFDISAVALDCLAERNAGLVAGGRLVLTGPKMADLEAAIDRGGPVDLVMLAFGVLGHVAGRRQRLALLRGLKSMLVPGGSLLLGVPNALRRFRRAQRDNRAAVADGRLEPGDILYRRAAADHEIDLYYHLYTLDEIRHDVEQAGFVVETVTAESALPEHAVVCHPHLGQLDDWVSGLVPVRLAYGFLIIARRV